MKHRIASTQVTLELGDITRHEVGAIVNAANSSLLGGGGVDGAIHRAGGPTILDECRDIRARQGGCRPGDAVVTTAGRLPAEYVIHTVGPVWQEGHAGENETLESCYRSCLKLAVENNVKSIAFPSISTGVYRFPVDRAARVALSAVSGYIGDNTGLIERVTWVLFDKQTFEAYEKVKSTFQ